MPLPPSSTEDPDIEKLAASLARPEWLRVDSVERIFGIKKSVLYELIAKKKVKSVSLRQRGTTRGTRLISYDSLNALIARAASGKTV